MSLTRTALAILFFSATCHAAEWTDDLPLLSSDKFTERVAAQERITDALNKAGDKATLEKNLDQLLEVYGQQTEPESRYRLLAVMQELSANYKKTLGPPLLGVNVSTSSIRLANQLTPAAHILSVQTGSPAHKAGLKSGDKIIGVGKSRLGSSFNKANVAFTDLIDLYAPGETVTIEIVRDGVPQSITVLLGLFSEKTTRKPSNLLADILLGKKRNTVAEKPIKASPVRQFDNLVLPKSFDKDNYFSRWFKSKQKH